jgi:hypothetical protein
MAAEMIEIADDGKNDWMDREISKGRVITVPDHELVQRSRLRIDTRKWILAKLLPKVYGDRAEQVMTWPSGEAPVLNVTISNGSSGDKPKPV